MKPKGLAFTQIPLGSMIGGGLIDKPLLLRPAPALLALAGWKSTAEV
jgi:hypothetical protein